MIFEPAPPNDFAEFIATYYQACRRAAPQIEAIGGKWTFEDLVPGMSDFDYRFICANGMSADDWCRMASVVGQVHLELCEAHPEWARKLEHLPGINLTWDELTDPRGYCTDYSQWTFYHTTRPERLEQATQGFAQRPWSEADELYHLQKFLTYYTPYDRSLDPAINLGPYDNKYPLHSRIMHYFPPPVQSAISIMQRETLAGKMAALRLAGEMFPETDVFAEALDLVARHYEVPELYQDPALAQLEARLFAAIELLGGHLADKLTIVPEASSTSPQQWRQRLKQRPVDPARTVCVNSKWARLTKGRLYFYANAPCGFATAWLIRNECKLIRTMFFTPPLTAFWELTRGEKVSDPAQIIPQLVPDPLTDQEAECCLTVGALVNDCQEGRETEVARQLVQAFDGFYHALHKLSAIAAEW